MDAIKRSINSERDLRNFLNTGSLDVKGYIGELSYLFRSSYLYSTESRTTRTFFAPSVKLSSASTTPS